MNNGKICISVCAETAGEFLKKIESARGLADVVELRFDCLNSEDVYPLREEIYKEVQRSVPFITTFRSTEQGGHREIAFAERKDFWNSGYETEFADVEEDLIEDSFSWLWIERICSFHDFRGVPKQLERIYDRLYLTDPDIVKIAVRVNDAVEAIPIWQLLKSVVAKGKKIIPIAMGEAGKWTRILGLAHGAYLTYASPESGSETAPGQITVREMRDVFRVKALDESTDVYGIIAGNTNYTMSPYIHNAAFKAKGLNTVFVPFQVADLDAFMRRMVKPETREVELNFKGFSVTNPHKQAVMKYLDFSYETAEKTGAVNTIKVEGGKLYGHNTDAEGFLQSIKGHISPNERVAVVGAGGAARACVFALTTVDTDVTVFSRDPKSAMQIGKQFNVPGRSFEQSMSFGDFDTVINATPLGTRGKSENETIATADQLCGVSTVYDLVYNPQETRLLREAKAAGAETIGGFDMLMAQAERQFNIWTGQNAPTEEMTAAAKMKLDES